MPQERNKVQAFNDFLVFGTMAVGSFFSGQLLANYGWSAWSIRRCCSGSGCWRSPPLPGGGGPVCKRWQNFPTRPFEKSVKMRRFDEVAWQEWRGDKIFRERFFYDPTKVIT